MSVRKDFPQDYYFSLTSFVDRVHHRRIAAIPLVCYNVFGSLQWPTRSLSSLVPPAVSDCLLPSNWQRPDFASWPPCATSVAASVSTRQRPPPASRRNSTSAR